jgi:hypothetical protein
MTTRIQQLQDEIARWSDATFGDERPPTRPLHHLAMEVQELIAEPHDDEEYADCLILLLDAYRMAGGNTKQLLDTAFQKLEINKQRDWGTPDENGVVEHIRNQP